MIRVITLASLGLHLVLFLSACFSKVKCPALESIDFIRIAFFILSFILFLISRTFLYFLRTVGERGGSFIRYVAAIFYFPSLAFPFFGYFMALWSGNKLEYLPFLIIGLFYIFRFYRPYSSVVRGESL